MRDVCCRCPTAGVCFPWVAADRVPVVEVRRPKACACFARRSTALELVDMLPDVSVGIVMRVLKMSDDNQHQAAEWLLTHSAEGLGDASEDLPECADKSHVFLTLPGRGAARPVKHNCASVGGHVPASPGITAEVVVAQPATAITPLTNAAR